MDPKFVETVCSVCVKSLRMKSGYGVIGLHCQKTNGPNYRACLRIANCPLGKGAAL